MCPSPEPDEGARRSAGFTLIEVMVAMGIFLVVAAAVAPLIVGSLRGAAVARDISQSKGVAQAQLEKMRDLPFFVGRAAGDFKDVLDTYYRNRSPATPASPVSCGSTTLSALPPEDWTGYVGASATHCVWEPPGQLYRKVVNPVVAPGLGVFSMVISTQFLSAATPPVAVAPPASYDSQTPGLDAPPSSQVGVTVAVFYKTQSGVRYTVTYTQVEQANPIAPLLTSEAKSSTVRVSSALADGTNILEQLGVINLSGELFSGSRVVATASAATAGTSLGEQITGAAVNLVAPVDQPTTSRTVGNLALPSSSCSYECFGDTKVDQASASASNGLPLAGTPTAPVRAMITTANNNGFQFSNVQPASDNRLKLKTSEPMVSLDPSNPASLLPISNCTATGTSSGVAYLKGTGFLNATATSGSSCGTAQSNIIRLFPTTFAPKGVVQISLASATASCRASSTGSTATAGYRATVSWWNGTGYTTPLPLAAANADPAVTDPLTNVNLSQSVDASGLTLGDYISSWKSLVSTDLKATTGTRSAEANVPGAISLITQPTREGVAGGEGPHLADRSSVISLTVGAVSCKVSDSR